MKKVTKVLAAIMLMGTAIYAVGFTGFNYNTTANINTKEENIESVDGHDYVDLGLPSGTLWATCNVGATTCEGYGVYFAWGETTVYKGWDNYKYRVDRGTDKLTKYCQEPESGYKGFTDNLTRLQPMDDAATVNWGSGWYTPTKEQWDELCKYTYSKWTTQNGVKGRLFNAPNGKCIFLPASGHILSDWGLNEEGERG